MDKTSANGVVDLPLELARRVWIENVRPEIDGGRFPIKRTVGEEVRVTADILADGHDDLSAVLRHRAVSAQEWTEVAMVPLGNDVWQAGFTVGATETCLYTIEAWVDRFGSWRRQLRKKFEAGQDVRSELLEGGALVAEAASRASEADAAWLRARADLLEEHATEQDRVAVALSDDLALIMARYPDRSGSTTYDRTLEVSIDRELARFGAWYEFFPRSAASSPGRTGTFRDAEERLIDIARMGFDVVYLPPIHPIGHTNRKGANNRLAAGPDDVGSPWAIGSEQGGHKAVYSDLGTLEDFDRFLERARRSGLEVALDLAFQCSPDHPYVREHPEWFLHRPDGSIKYAENPPKRYEDIYPLNFECADWETLWQELKSVALFWIGRGVRIFRVDNPHTKPLRFWGWLIREVRSEYPETIFLAEAFTRPKVMYALAKVGFQQSYTYFTWRNEKQEITSYLTELTRSGVREYFRPNLFTNTPDILPEYLQFGGRSAFLARLVLAATLGATYGIYSGFELCEGRAVPGTEEYADSEKYQIRHWDWDRPGNIREFIARVNKIRRDNPALASNDRLRFYVVDNEQLIFYGKTTQDLSNIILVVGNLDPHRAHDGWVEVPIEEFGIGANEVYQVHDLIGDGRYLWRGSRNYVRLDPTESPAQIYRLRRRVRSEKDFEYFL
jgi:starch synthase (maltosyl-transferring)